MQVAILGDTHVPTREPGIPGWIEAEIADADHVIFTGDFDTQEAYDELTRLTGGNFTAVRGNLDPADLDLAEVVSVELGGVEFVVTHGTGPTANYESRVRKEVLKHGDEEAVGVAGHTHKVLDTEVDGVRLLNPGSATGADPAPEATMMVAEVEDGDLDVTVLEPRGEPR